MRILAIASSTGLSHIVRTLELARHMRRSGHDVFVGYGVGEWRKLAHSYGFAAEPLYEPELGPPFTMGIGSPTIRGLRLSYRSELALIEKIRPNLVIADWRFTAWASASAKGIPAVHLWNANWGMFAGHPEVVRHDLSPSYRKVLEAWKAALDAFRSEVDYTVGRKEEPHIFRGQLNLIPDDPLFRSVDSSCDRGDLRWIGPLVPVPTEWSDGRKAATPKLLGIAFGGHHLEQLHSMVERAGARSGFQPVDLRSDSHRPSSGAGRVVQFSFFPLNLLECELVVSHGGAGSIYQSIMACKPVLALPQHLEQYDNGIQLERLGIGLCLHPKRQTEEEIQRAILELSFLPMENLRSMATRLRQQRPTECAQQLLERWI